MGDKILVAYASRAGSTAGVADAIGETLATDGVQVDVLPVQDVKDLSPYRAVVAGSAIQGGRWLPEAVQFLRTHQSALARKPFAAFLVCMTLAMPSGDKHRLHVATWLDPVRALVKPVDTGLFAGVLDVSQVPSFLDRLKFRLSVLFGVWSEGDHRDWDAIEPPSVMVGIIPERYTYELINRDKEFGVNIPTTEQIALVRTCGSISGRDGADKYNQAGVTPFRGSKIKSYLIQECPVNIECVVVHEVGFTGTHQWYVGEIQAVHVDDMYTREQPLMFWSGEYREVGEFLEKAW